MGLTFRPVFFSGLLFGFFSSSRLGLTTSMHANTRNYGPTVRGHVPIARSSRYVALSRNPPQIPAPGRPGSILLFFLRMDTD